MFYLLGFQQCMNLIARAIHATPGDLLQLTLNDLRAIFYHQITAKSAHSLALSPAGPEFVTESDKAGVLLSAFIEDASVDDGLLPITNEIVNSAATYPEAGLRWNEVITREAIQLLTELEPELTPLLWICVQSIFFADVPGNIGGSTCRSIGNIWVNIPTDADKWDVAEFILHELTHQLLHVDGLTQAHLENQAYTQKAKSAIRGTARPLECVADSVYVAYEILSFRAKHMPKDRQKFRIHPADAVLKNGALQSITSIRELAEWRNYFTPRGRELFLNAALDLAKFA